MTADSPLPLSLPSFYKVSSSHDVLLALNCLKKLLERRRQVLTNSVKLLGPPLLASGDVIAGFHASCASICQATLHSLTTASSRICPGCHGNGPPVHAGKCQVSGTQGRLSSTCSVVRLVLLIAEL